ncbi:rhoGEF domain-containing protein [Ditylenchus destructor]|nr:rhoGEF domain-containing protein [Ditylenchus destructor]
MRTEHRSTVSAPALHSVEFITVDLLMLNVEVGTNSASGSSNTAQLMEAIPGKKLSECLEPFLHFHGIPTQCAEFLLEKSATPVPGNSDAKFLAGHKVFVRLKPGGTFSRRRGSHLANLLSGNSTNNGSGSNSMASSVHHNSEVISNCVESSGRHSKQQTQESDQQHSSTLASLISRKPSFSNKKMMGKPRSLSTCPPTSSSSQIFPFCHSSCDTSMQCSSSISGSISSIPTEHPAYPPPNPPGSIRNHHPGMVGDPAMIPSNLISNSRKNSLNAPSDFCPPSLHGLFHNHSGSFDSEANDAAHQQYLGGCYIPGAAAPTSAPLNEGAIPITQSFGTLPSQNGSEDYGTKRAPRGSSASNAGGTVTRRGIFAAKEKIGSVLDKIFVQVVSNRLCDLCVLEIEPHWSDLVRCHKIVTTEKRYINLLQNMEDLTFSFAEVQKQGYLRDINSRRVFLNYSELLRCNLAFWNRAILPMLNAAREKSEPLNPRLMLSGFESIVEWSRCYIEFNMGHSDSHSYVQKKQKDNEMFAEFIRWAESHSMMHRQKLLDALSTPMQRLTRYSLLLKAVLKASSDTEEKLAIQTMIDNAEAATLRLNYELNNNDLRIQLSEIMKTIESYEAIDNEEFEKLFQMRSMPHLNLLNPMPFLGGAAKYRRMYTKGDLKMRESRQGAKMDVHCIIFTDMLLICKMASKRADRLRVIKPPMHISNLIFHPFSEGNGFYLICMNEFETASHLLMLFTTGVEETRRWLEMMAMAQDEYRCLQRSATGNGEFDSYSTLDSDRHLHGCVRKDSMTAFRSVPPAPPPYTNSHMGHPFITNTMMNCSNLQQQQLPQGAIAHRKSHSMDSQVVAAASRPNSAQLRKYDAIVSAEQLDRYTNGDEAGVPAGCSSVATRSVESLLSNTEECHQRTCSETQAQDSSKPHRVQDEERRKTLDTIAKPSTDSAVESLEDTEERDSYSIDQNTSQPDSNPQSTETVSSKPVASQIPVPNGSAMNGGRRFEKRYHTVGEIDGIKSTNGTTGTSGCAGFPPSGGILKRFSWNVSSAMSGSSRKISSKFNELNGRRFSQSTAGSNDSFGSSTSGISSASQSSQTEAATTISAASALSTATNDTLVENPAQISNCVESNEAGEEVEISASMCLPTQACGITGSAVHESVIPESPEPITPGTMEDESGTQEEKRATTPPMSPTHHMSTVLLLGEEHSPEAQKRLSVDCETQNPTETNNNKININLKHSPVPMEISPKLDRGRLSLNPSRTPSPPSRPPPSSSSEEEISAKISPKGISQGQSAKKPSEFFKFILDDQLETS